MKSHDRYFEIKNISTEPYHYYTSQYRHNYKHISSSTCQIREMGVVKQVTHLQSTPG